MGKVIAFVSFKGGTGRSTALVNVAYRLAQTSRVGCMDFDLESCGLSYIFRPAAARDHIQDYLIDPSDYTAVLNEQKPNYDDNEVFCKKLVFDIDKELALTGLRGCLKLLAAGTDAKRTGLVLSSSGHFKKFKRLLDRFSEACVLDHVLIDCRSGISELALPTLAFADAVLVFYRWGLQHREGTKEIVRWMNEWLQRANEEAKLFLVPSAIPERLQVAACQFADDHGFRGAGVRRLGLISDNPEFRESEQIVIPPGDTYDKRRASGEYDELMRGLCRELA